MIRVVTERQSDSQFTLRTIGLISTGHSEIRVEVGDSELIGDASLAICLQLCDHIIGQADSFR